jgi:hypothetical protein
MRKKISKATIVNLIKDDLKHQHTVLGLNLLGYKHDDSSLDICISIFSLMELNINDKRLERLTDEYCDRSYHVTEIAFNDSESFNRMAEDIYHWLTIERRKYRKLLAKT